MPGYFAVVTSRPRWDSRWNNKQRFLLVGAATLSTIAPDLDVIYNTLFRGFTNHSTLWTHSLFVHLGIASGWWLLRRIRRWPYLQTLVGLIAVGGLSHLALDVISHGTPLLYPISSLMFGFPPQRVLEGGFWAYVTDPIFLIEPLLLTIAALHWTFNLPTTLRTRRIISIVLVGTLVSFVAAFLFWLPVLQRVAAHL